VAPPVRRWLVRKAGVTTWGIAFVVGKVNIRELRPCDVWSRQLKQKYAACELKRFSCRRWTPRRFMSMSKCCKRKCALAAVHTDKRPKKSVKFRVWNKVTKGNIIGATLIALQWRCCRGKTLCCKKHFDPFGRFDSVPACDRQTDRHRTTVTL